MAKRITIYDIAQKLGISTTTVYRALNEKPKVSMDTRNAVLETAREMGFKPNTLARSLARKKIKLAVIAFTSFPEFHKSFLNGARDAHNELEDYNIQVEYFSYEDGDSNSPAGDAYLFKQLEHIENGGYDGLLVCAKETEQFRELTENGIYVATAINDISEDFRKFCIRYNGRVAGQMAAELLWMNMDRSKKVAIASGLEGQGIHAETEEGFLKQLTITPLKLAEIYYNFDNVQYAYSETNAILDKYPDLGGIYVNSFNSSGVLKSVEERGLGGRITIVTSDIYDELRRYIERGVVTASIFQDQYTQGKMGLKMLYQSIAEDLEVKDTTLINPQIILRSNMKLYK
ncbi:MAG: substrate-binding domain-containing protein [Christensenellales bacterium]|jgi:LacI family transcriptional regulator